MNNLELVKSFNFNDIECDIYSKDNEVFMTGEQLGKVLGYQYAREGINKIVSRNEYLKDKEFSAEVKMTSPSGIQTTRVFTEDGIYEVTMLSKTETGKKFYDKSRYSNKQVETFRYYDNAIEKFRELV